MFFGQKASTFFNRVSLKQEPSWSYSVTAKDSDQRAKLMLATLTGPAVASSLIFKPAQNTWAQKFLGNSEGTLAYRAETATHVVEVLDVPPRGGNWSRDHGDLYSVERLVGVYAKDKKPGDKGTVFMRLSSIFAPTVCVMTGNGGNACLTPGLGGSSTQVAVDVADQLIRKINRNVRAPEWVRKFNNHFKVVDGTNILRTKRTPAPFPIH